jgi:hypothetical protein
MRQEHVHVSVPPVLLRVRPFGRFNYRAKDGPRYFFQSSVCKFLTFQCGGTESNERSHLVDERIGVTRIKGNALEPSQVPVRWPARLRGYVGVSACVRRADGYVGIRYRSFRSAGSRFSRFFHELHVIGSEEFNDILHVIRFANGPPMKSYS